MSSRRKPETRCPVCRLKRKLCLCREIAELRLELNPQRIRSDIVIHHREERRTSNTGRLASSVLNGSKLHLYGLAQKKFVTESFFREDTYRPVVLCLSERAVEIDSYCQELAHDQKIQLIVPDGNWRQASKIPFRVESFRDLDHVKLASGAQSEYELRHEPKENGLATFEAIARIHGLLESKLFEEKMMELFREFVSRHQRGS